MIVGLKGIIRAGFKCSVNLYSTQDLSSIQVTTIVSRTSANRNRLIRSVNLSLCRLDSATTLGNMSEISFNFKGKKAIVTGASRGIGRDIVRALSEANIDKVYAIARNPKNLELLNSDFPCVETISVDLADWNATRKAVETIEPVDFLVNNAGDSFGRDVVDFDPDDFDKLMDVNVKSVVNVSQLVCAKMMERGGGVVVNMSSTAAFGVFPRQFIYSASKVALDTVTKQMAMEFAPTIRVNSVNPTLTPTHLAARFWDEENTEKLKKIIPLRRIAKVEEVSNATLFLLSNGASMITGHFLPVSGGQQSYYHFAEHL